MSENAPANAAPSAFEKYKNLVKDREEKALSLDEYLELCKTDKGAYASASERLLKAIGEPKIVDTKGDPQLSRVFSNNIIARYPTFSDFFDAEETVMSVVNHLRHAAQGLEESKQVLYLLGPVGGGKSSIAERLKELMQKEPFYTLQYTPPSGKPQLSPVNESPLPLIVEIFKTNDNAGVLTSEYGINERRLKVPMSPWALKRLEECGGDLARFSVIKRYPSISKQVAISKTEPGDENNQDISALVGKVDIRKLEEFEQKDPDAYSYSGGLCLSNQGLLEFVEMFKAPIKVLHPLLTATQEGNFKGTEAIGNIPFDGIILAHSNESEWNQFKNNKNNEAFLDRVNIVKVPYSLRVSQEAEIYKKMLANSTLKDAPCAPKTLEMAAELAVMTRLAPPADEGSIYSKLKVYDGYDYSDIDPKAKRLKEYKEDASRKEEGMSGISTRFMFKTLSAVFNHSVNNPNGELAADPVKLMAVLEDHIKAEKMDQGQEKKYLDFIHDTLRKKYFEFLGSEIKDSFLENSKEYGQHVFDRYFMCADFWIRGEDYVDPQTQMRLDRDALEAEMQRLEKPAGIANVKDFRNDIVMFVQRAQLKNGGANPDWTSYEKIKKVIEKTLNTNLKDILPVISFGKQKSTEDEKAHQNFVNGMVKRGYTPKMVRSLSEWYDKQALSMS